MLRLIGAVSLAGMVMMLLGWPVLKKWRQAGQARTLAAPGVNAAHQGVRSTLAR